MGEKKLVEALIEGGKATGGPPLGPALGPLGVNIIQIVNRVNELTAPYAGMKVPIRIEVDMESKSFEVTVGTPSSSALIAKELGLEKGSGNPKAQKVGDLALEQIVKLAKMKKLDSYARSVRSSAKEILGTCVSMGVTVTGRDAREIIKELDAGSYASYFEDEVKGG